MPVANPRQVRRNDGSDEEGLPPAREEALFTRIPSHSPLSAAGGSPAAAPGQPFTSESFTVAGSMLSGSTPLYCSSSSLPRRESRLGI